MLCKKLKINFLVFWNMSDDRVVTLNQVLEAEYESHAPFTVICS
jgi:hypothetical protein